MYGSSPFRSTLNRGYITCLGMCKVCTEAVHLVALCPAKKAQTPKHGPGKKDRNRARGVFQGRRTSRSAGIYIYILHLLLMSFPCCHTKGFSHPPKKNQPFTLAHLGRPCEAKFPTPSPCKAGLWHGSKDLRCSWRLPGGPRAWW